MICSAGQAGPALKAILAPASSYIGTEVSYIVVGAGQYKCGKRSHSGAQECWQWC